MRIEWRQVRRLTVRGWMRPGSVRRARQCRRSDQQEIAVTREDDRITDEIAAAVDQAAVEWRQQRWAFDG